MNEKVWKEIISKSLKEKGFSNYKIREILKYLTKLKRLMSEKELEIIYAKD